MSRHEIDAALSRCGAGDLVAFGAVYDHTIEDGLRLATCMVTECDAAEEVVLEAYLEVWRYAHQFDPAGGSAVAWVLDAVHRRGRARTANPR